MSTPAQQWRDQLDAWRIDPDILAAAPESPYGFPPALFGPRPEPDDGTPSRRRALEALPDGGTVLDVGCGGGAGALALVPPAGRVIGVDESADMLSAFAGRARDLAVPYDVIEGRWPDVAATVPQADVVVCHHVAYNVPDLAEFAAALDRHARRRVVMELTVVHPWVPMGPLWRHFHGQDRPAGPDAALAAEVLHAQGLPVTVEQFTRPARHLDDRPQLVAFTRRRLCLPVEREPEVDALLGNDPVLTPRAAATLWWDVGSNA